MGDYENNTKKIESLSQRVQNLLNEKSQTEIVQENIKLDTVDSTKFDEAEEAKFDFEKDNTGWEMAPSALREKINNNKKDYDKILDKYNDELYNLLICIFEEYFSRLKPLYKFKLGRKIARGRSGHIYKDTEQNIIFKIVPGETIVQEASRQHRAAMLHLGPPVYFAANFETSQKTVFGFMAMQHVEGLMFSPVDMFDEKSTQKLVRLTLKLTQNEVSASDTNGPNYMWTDNHKTNLTRIDFDSRKFRRSVEHVVRNSNFYFPTGGIGTFWDPERKCKQLWTAVAAVYILCGNHFFFQDELEKARPKERFDPNGLKNLVKVSLRDENFQTFVSKYKVVGKKLTNKEIEEWGESLNSWVREFKQMEYVDGNIRIFANNDN